MKSTALASVRSTSMLMLTTALCFALLLPGDAGGRAQAADASTSRVAAPSVTCPGGRCFADVPASNTFYAYINALYMDGIISGYACGDPGESCDSESRPYYRPANNVTRGQMSKFLDEGRRNIATAVGQSLTLSAGLNVSGTTTITGPLAISTNTFNAIVAQATGGGEVVDSRCLSPGPCWAIEGNASNDGNYGGVFGNNGLVGISASQDDPNGYAVEGLASGSGAYAGYFDSSTYRSLYVAGSAAYYGLFVEGTASGLGAYVNGDVDVTGDLYVAGTCCGPSSTIVQNVGANPLQVGDVVTIVGSGPAVLGDTPVLLVEKASSAYDVGAAGVVGGGMHVPDAATRALYLEQERSRKAAHEAHNTQMLETMNKGKVAARQGDAPTARITDAQGTVREDPSMATIPTGGYAKLLTSGSVRALKVDASFGAIKSGDLLTTSTNPGFAMKVTDRTAATGAIIGKAMGDLNTGTGTIPVLVILK